VTRDSEATRARILDAATEEFAGFGLAGARVDRLAARAKANKQLIYAYFGSKEQLFDRTLEVRIEELLDAVPFDADDLAGYASALFDYNHAHPELVRLVLWHLLERPGVLFQLPQAADSTARKVTALAAAQARGVVAPTPPAAELLDLLLALVHGGQIELDATAGQGARLSARRAALTEAVRRLTAP
jgi:AcrR family transcriptional regulator